MTRPTVAIELVGVGELLRDLSALAQAAELFPQVRQAIVDLGDLATHVRCVHVDDLAASADQLRVQLELSDALAQLVAAARAGDVDGLRVQNRFHGRSFRGEG